MPAVDIDAQVLHALQSKIDADPDIQQLLMSNALKIKQTHDKGGAARKFQNQLSDQITAIAKKKGYLPHGKVFVNPNDGKIEGKGGWAGLPTAAKIAIIGGVAATGIGAGLALGAGGAGAAAGAGGASAATGGGAAAGAAAGTIPTIGATSGLAAGAFPAIAGTAGAGAGGSMGVGSSILGFLKGNTGSILDTIGKVSKGVAQPLGQAAGAQASARSSEAQQQILRDRLNMDKAQSEASQQTSNAATDLNQRAFKLQAPGARLSTGVQGSAVSRAHNITAGTGAPITLSSGKVINPIQFNGGGPDDLLSDDARSLGSMVTRQMLEDQTAGDHFDPLQKTSFPGATPAQPESGSEKLLGGAALGTSLLGSLSPILSSLLKKKSQLSLGDTPMDEDA